MEVAMAGKTYVDFADIKRRVTLEQVLRHYKLFETLSGTGTQRKAPDPFNDGPKGKSQPLAVNLEKNVWTLFSKDQRTGGNVIDFVMRKESCDVREAALKLSQWFELSAPSGRDTEKVADVQPAKAGAAPTHLLSDAVQRDNPRSEPFNKPLGFALQGLDAHHEALSPLLTQWGIDRRVVASFGAGYYTGNGKAMKGRLAVPIYRDDQRVGYCGISVQPDDSPLYKFPAGWVPGVELYNLTFARRAVEVMNKRAEGVELLVFRDILQVWQATQLGYPASVAVMGEEITPGQLALLRGSGLLHTVSIALQLHLEESIL